MAGVVADELCCGLIRLAFGDAAVEVDAADAVSEDEPDTDAGC